MRSLFDEGIDSADNFHECLEIHRLRHEMNVHVARRITHVHLARRRVIRLRRACVGMPRDCDRAH